jgi:hypothetical protein
VWIRIPAFDQNSSRASRELSNSSQEILRLRQGTISQAESIGATQVANGGDSCPYGSGVTPSTICSVRDLPGHDRR